MLDFFRGTESVTVVMLLHCLFYFCFMVQLCFFSCMYVCILQFLVLCIYYLLSFPSSLGSSLWHSEEWHRYCRHVCDEAGAHHEVHHPCGHGGYHSHLRPGSSGADCQQHLREDHPFQVSLIKQSHFNSTLFSKDQSIFQICSKFNRWGSTDIFENAGFNQLWSCSWICRIS